MFLQLFYTIYSLHLKYDRKDNSLSKDRPKSLLKPVEQRMAQITPKSPAKDHISTSRMNLLNALNKAKSQQSIQPIKKEKSPDSTASSSPPISEHLSEKSLRPSLQKMEDDEDEELKARQIIQNQEMFLRLFGLYTHEKVQEMRSRRRERRRRNITSTEKIDFHYGRIDYYDPKMQAKKKTSIMYSPPATRALKKKRITDTTYSTSTTKSKLCNTCNIASSEYNIVLFKLLH